MQPFNWATVVLLLKTKSKQIINIEWDRDFLLIKTLISNSNTWTHLTECKQMIDDIIIIIIIIIIIWLQYMKHFNCMQINDI